MLTLQDFSKSYSGVKVISVESLCLSSGIYWIQGENGSGKTTFFKAMAGLHPCEGKIEFEDGTNLHKHPVEFRRRVNYSEAEPLYPGFLTAKDLVRFVGKAKGANKEQHEYFVEKFGVSEFFEKPCETFSSGMLKKLSLALAFLGSPKLIILDEPLITLDAKARITLLQIIECYLKEHEVTFLFSSHQAIESQSIALSGSFIVSNKTILPC